MTKLYSIWIDVLWLIAFTLACVNVVLDFRY